MLEVIREERTKQIGHFDALDNKAGIVLGFAGLLITLAPDVSLVLLVPALVAAGAAAAFALLAFWPRPHATLQPTPMRKYLAADDRFTRLRLFDTLEVLVNTVSYDLTTKARRLKRALIALGVAAALFAAGILVAAFKEAAMSDQPQDQPEELPEPPEPDPDPELIGYFERGYPGPRESKGDGGAQ